MHHTRLQRGLIAFLCILVCTSTPLHPTQAAVNGHDLEDVPVVETRHGPNRVQFPRESKRSSPEQTGTITIQDNNFEGNGDYGLESNTAIKAENNWWRDPNGPQHASNPLGDGDAVSDNVDFDPWLTSAVDIGIPLPPYPEPGAIVLSQNSFEDNGTYGVQSSIPIAAENNWWGHASGPYHPTLNQDGQGDNVSDNVDFDPWLTSPPGSGDPPVLSVSPTLLDFSDTASYLTFQISNMGASTLEWTISENTIWLGATSVSGDTSGDGSYSGQGNETIGVVVGRIGRAHGTYTAEIQVTSNGGSVSIPVTMTVNSTGVSAANSALTIDSALVLANGTETAELTVVVRDLYNNPVSGKTVQLVSSRGTADTITPISSQTDADGRFVATISSSTAGESEISAIVQPEGVEIDQTVQVIFYSGQGLDAMLTGGWLQSQLDNLDRLLVAAETAAQDGDYFREKKGEDQVELVVDSVFGAISVIMPLAHQVPVHHATQIHQVGGYLDVSQISHSGQYVFDISNSGRIATAPVLEVTAHNYGAVMYEVVEHNTDFWTDVAEHALHHAIEHESREAIVGILTLLLEQPDAFTLIMYPENESLVTSYKRGLQDYADLVANDLPPLSPDEANAYRYDLAGRNAVPVVLVRHVEDAAAPLNQSRLEREWDEAHWYITWLKIGAKIAIPILVNVAFDGPAWVVTGVAVATNAAFAGWEIYEDVSELSLDDKMIKLAFDLQTHIVPDTADRIFLNGVRGIHLIDGQLLPQTVYGRVRNIKDVSVGHYRLFGRMWWSEDMSYTEVTVENTSDHTALFQAYATAHTEEETFVSEGVVEIQPGQTGMLRIPWKDASHGESPEFARVEIVGTSSTGAYYVASTIWDFNPVRVEQTGSGFSHRLEIQQATSAMTLESDPQIPTIPNPISSRMLGQRTSLNATHYILAENPFTNTITVSITQRIPTSVTVVEPDTLNLGADSVSWQTTIAPTGLVSLTYELRYNGAVGTEIEMPPTHLTILDDGGSPLVVFEGNTVTLVSKSPLVVDGGPPLEIPRGVAATMPLTVTNLSESTISGSITVQVKTTSGTVVFDQSSPFSVDGQDSQGVGVSLLLNEPLGQYIVSATVTQGSDPEQVFERFIQIVESTTGENPIYLPLVLRND